MPPRRAHGGIYPLWVALASIALFTALWLARGPAQSADDPSDAEVPNAAAPSAPSSGSPSAESRPAELVWRLTQAPARSGAQVGACLRAAGWSRITAHGGGAYPVSVTYSPLILASIVTVMDDGLEVRTPMTARRHQAFALHTAIAACLPGSALVDPDLGALADAEGWPSAQRAAGMRVELAVRIDSVGDTLRARGLGRLGLMDLVLESPDTPVGRRRLQQAAALVLVQDDPDLVTMQFGDGQATLTPMDVPGLVRARRIALPAGAMAVAPPTRAPVRKPKAAPRRRTARTPRSPKPRGAKVRPRPAQPASKAPSSRWRPDYQ
ncbi:MAG: hypothetical protein ACI9U2_003457 [Bradymonadia bacterium]|jgi:hypothetical protein